MESASQDNFVKISDLHFSYGERLIFSGVDINIPQGKITAIMGPSGTGKTTLLRLIGAQLMPSQGCVLIEGIDVHQLSRKALYALRKRMGLLFQNGALFTNLNVFENVAFALREHTDLPYEMMRDLVLMQLEAVGLRGANDLMPNQLSGGMTHRVAMARALVFQPELMMYDEPFTGQDPITKGVLVKLIKRLNNILGITSIIVSHDVAETFQIADYVYLLAEGRVIRAGKPDEVLKDKEPWVEQFINGLPDGAVPFHYPAKDYSEDLGLC